MRIGRKSPISTPETLSVEAPKKQKSFSRKMGRVIGAGAILVNSFVPNIASANSEIEIPNDTEAVANPPLPAGTISDFFLEDRVVSFVNVTMTETAGKGFVQILPGILGRTSNGNSSFAGQTAASQAFVRPEAGGRAQLYNQVGGQFIVDQAGTFSEESIEIVTPERMFDSRNVGPQLRQGSFTVVGGFKPNSTVAVNLTTTETLCDGYIQLLESIDGPVGSYSSANAIKDREVPKIATARTNGNGEIVVFSSCRTHLVIDLQAYLNDVDDIVDERAIDTRRPGNETISAGTILEVKGRPNSTAFVSILTLESKAPGYVQVLPVNNPVIGSSSNLNMEPGVIVGGIALLEFGPDGIGRIFFQSATEAVVDIQAYLAPGSYTSKPDRLLDTRDGTQNRPTNPVCEKVVIAVGATATGRLEDSAYSYLLFDGQDNAIQRFSAPGLTFDTAGDHLEIDPATCNSPDGISVVYSRGDYPRAELFRRNLTTGLTTRVAGIQGKYERPEPQVEGIYALQTEFGVNSYGSKVVNTVNGSELYDGDVRDFSISDNGTTRAMIQGYFDAFGPNRTNQLFDRLYIDQYDRSTKTFFRSEHVMLSPNSNNRINAVEVSPDGETVAILRTTNGAVQELVVATPSSASITFRKIDLPNTYVPLSFRFLDSDSVIVSVVDNGSGGPILRLINVDLINGNNVVIDTRIQGRPIDIAM